MDVGGSKGNLEAIETEGNGNEEVASDPMPPPVDEFPEQPDDAEKPEQDEDDE